MKIEVDKEYLENLERDHKELKQAVETICFNTYTPGNGGYHSDFGPITFEVIFRITGFDVSKRKICKEDEDIEHGIKIIPLK
jgi:hypothetical protein